MQILKFKPEIKKGTLFLRTLLSFTMGGFEDLTAPDSTPVHGYLIGEVPENPLIPTPFEPLAFYRINDRGSLEYVFVGINPTLKQQLDVEGELYKVRDFLRKHFIVAAYGEAEVTERILSNFQRGAV